MLLAATFPAATARMTVAGYLGSTQSETGSGSVHGHVSASDDADLFSFQIRAFAFTDAAEHLDCADYVRSVFSLHAQLLVIMGSDGHVDCIVFCFQIIDGDVFAYIDSQFNVYAAVQNVLDILIKDLVRQTVIRNAVTEHTAQMMSLFIDRYIMPHEGQEVSGSKTSGTSANDGNRLAGGFLTLGDRNVSRMIDSIALDAADVHCIVHHGAAAALLAGMFTNVIRHIRPLASG